MHFSESSVRLGEVSYGKFQKLEYNISLQTLSVFRGVRSLLLCTSGFPKTETVVIINDSLNHVDLVLKMDKDGTEGKALTSDEILSAFDRDEVDFPEEPQEFTLDPLEFQLAPRGFQKIAVCYLSNASIDVYYNWKKPIRQKVS
jgi:hypothetical protein